MKRNFILIIMVLFSLSIYAQSDEILDILYAQESAQTIYTSLLVLQASGLLDTEATINDAKNYLEMSSWGNSILDDGEYISAGSFSLLVMESFNLPHGIMYNFLPIKRYALKEMVYQQYILGSPYPKDVMSSFEVVYAISSLPVPEGINKDYSDLEIDTSTEIESVNNRTEIDSPDDTPEYTPKGLENSDPIISTFK